MIPSFIRRLGMLVTMAGFIAFPTLVLASHHAGPATFQGSVTLWMAIIIGTISSILTIYHATQLGGTLAGVLWLFGIGMFLVVLGFLSIVVAWAEDTVQGLAHDTMFIIGYLVMMTGGIKLYQLSRIK